MRGSKINTNKTFAKAIGGLCQSLDCPVFCGTGWDFVGNLLDFCNQTGKGFVVSSSETELNPFEFVTMVDGETFEMPMEKSLPNVYLLQSLRGKTNVSLSS